MSWTWKGDCVHVNGAEHRIKRPVNREELNAFSEVFALRMDVFSMLNTAMSAFSSGQAVYENCRENAENLSRGFRSAQVDAGLVAADVGLFFDPIVTPGELSQAEKLRFAIEAVRAMNLEPAPVAPIAAGEPKG